MTIVFKQLVVKHLFAERGVDHTVWFNTVLQQTHHLSVGGVLGLPQLLVKRCVGRSKRDALPRRVVDPHLVTLRLHAVLASALAQAIRQIRELCSRSVRYLINRIS